MPDLLATAILWVAAASILVAQTMILRSTRRALRAGAVRVPVREWAFAIVPALALLLVLLLSWQAATRPPVIEVQVIPGIGELRS